MSPSLVGLQIRQFYTLTHIYVCQFHYCVAGRRPQNSLGFFKWTKRSAERNAK